MQSDASAHDHDASTPEGDEGTPATESVALDEDARVRLALEASGLGTWEWDAATGEVVWDRALERIYGLNEGTFPRTYEAYLALLHPADREMVATTSTASLEAGGDHKVEHRVIWPDGSIHWVEGWGRVLRAPDGAPRGLMGVSGDITERKLHEERLRQLQEVTVALAEARTTEEVGLIALHELVAATDAAGSTLLLLEADGTHINVVATSLPEADLPEDWRRFTTDSPLTGAEAIRSGRTVIRPARVAGGPSAALAQMRTELGEQAVVVAVPLRAGNRMLGAIGLTLAALPSPTQEWQDFMTTLGDQFGQALERAQLYEAEQEAMYRLRLLADASRLLGSSLEYEQTLREVAASAVPDFADWCTVDLVDDHGGLQLLAVAHADPEKVQLARDLRERYPPDPEAPTGTSAVVRTGKSELLPEIPKELLDRVVVEFPELGDLIEQLHLTSAMTVPLIARGRVLGAMSFVWGESERHYDETDLAIAQELALRAAISIDNARIFDEQRRVADTLQSSLRPPLLPEIPGIELAAEYHPGGAMLEVAGDFYDVFELRPGSWFAVVGDVCGKGVDAAAVMALARYTIRTAALRQVRPSGILSTLNEALLRSGFDRFVTVAALRIDEGEQFSRVTLSCAGHPEPMLVSGGDATLVQVPGTLLGVVESPELTDHSFELKPGDCLVLYTDGVTEEHRGSELFGDERLLDLGRALGDEPVAVFAKKIVERVESFGGGRPADDIAVLAVRRV
ncbi:MAG: SpoIIE family protein phosphatase [Actinomycetota bacterium]